MLDFQQRPSERLAEAAAIAATLHRYEAVFAPARPVTPRATVLLSLESTTLQATGWP